MKEMTNIYWVGALQDLGRSYVDLYFNKDSQALFLLVKLKETDDKGNYALIAVSPEQIKEYMEGEKPLGDLFSNQPYRKAFIKDKKVGYDETELISKPDIFIYNLPFDAELSSNKGIINVVLKRMMRGRAI